MGQGERRGRDLETTREALTSWRGLHGGRGRPIPAALWAQAAEVARVDGVAETARALRLDPRKLAKLADGLARVVESAGFVELGGLVAGEPAAAGKAVFELVGREGDRVRVEGAGAVGAVDLVALARAFWSRST